MSDSAHALVDERNAVCKTQSARTFIIRVWLEDLGEGKIEWRGRVQDVSSGQVHFFRSWEQLVATILEMLANRTNDARDASVDGLPAQVAE